MFIFTEYSPQSRSGEDRQLLAWERARIRTEHGKYFKKVSNTFHPFSLRDSSVFPGFRHRFISHLKVQTMLGAFLIESLWTTPPGWVVEEHQRAELHKWSPELSHIMPREWRRPRLLDCGCGRWRWTLWAPRRAPLTSCRRCWPGNAAWPSPTPPAAAGAGSPGRWCRWLPGAPRWRSPHVSKHLRLQRGQKREPRCRVVGERRVQEKQKQIEINYIK